MENPWAQDWQYVVEVEIESSARRRGVLPSDRPAGGGDYGSEGLALGSGGEQRRLRSHTGHRISNPGRDNTSPPGNEEGQVQQAQSLGQTRSALILNRVSVRT